MFAYEVMSEQEALEERFNLLKEGIYDAVISASQDKVSASGNPMMDMTLQVFDEDGKSRSVRDFLVFTKSTMWKVIRFANAAGLLKVYEEGKLCSDAVVNQSLKVKIGIEKGGVIPQDKLNGKPEGSRYPDKNKVEDYVKTENKKTIEQVEECPFDDEINF